MANLNQKPATFVPVPVTIDQIITKVRDYWTSQYVLDYQDTIVEIVNAALISGNTHNLNREQEAVYNRMYSIQELEARTISQATKYSAVKAHKSDKIEVGTILVSSWGYDQTNVNFYCVVEMTAKMVKILPVSHARVESEGYGSMAGEAIATQKIDFSGELMTKKIGKDYGSGPNIKVSSCAYAGIWDGRKMYESWYA